MAFLFPAIVLCIFCTVSAVNLTKENFCFSAFPKWSVGNGNILLNGAHVFHIKGINWFGMETSSLAPHGLWVHSMEHFLKILRANSFNVVRIPFSVISVMNNPSNPDVSCELNPNLCKLSYLDLMEKVVDDLGKEGILVLLDQHRLYGKGDQELWYENPQFSEARILESWEILLSKLGRKWNLLGLDLKNEPHGAATWGMGNTTTDWNLAAQRIIRHIVKKFPIFQGLFFVQGVQDHASSMTPNNYAHFWGGNLEGVHKHPIRTGYPSLDKRVVYSPHLYGPDVWMQSYFRTSDFPSNMEKIWNLHFGFVELTTGHPVVVGEWGGQHWPGTKDRSWGEALGKFMLENCMSDSFYWSLNPNSGSTGGILLDDWQTVRTDKLFLLQNIQPNPSRLIQHRRMFCFYPGSPANKACHPSLDIGKPDYQNSRQIGPPRSMVITKENKQPVFVRPRPEPRPRPRVVLAPHQPGQGNPQQTLGQPGTWQPSPKPSVANSKPVFVRPGPQLGPRPIVVTPTQQPAPVKTVLVQPRPAPKPAVAAEMLEPTKPVSAVGSKQPEPVLVKSNPVSAPVQSMGLMAQVERTNTWDIFWPETVPVSELKIIFTNLGQARVCDAEFSLGDVTVQGLWNVYPEPEKPGVFSFPKWLKLNSGESYGGIGVIIYGKELPIISVLNVVYC